MDKQEAKKVLQAIRPNDLDTTEPAFAEALVLVESDPELKEWWEAQQAFDRAVVAKLKEVPIPDGIRCIIAGRRIPSNSSPPQLTSCNYGSPPPGLAIFCALGTSQYIQNYGPLPRSEYTASVLPFLGNNAPTLAMTSADRDKINAWLHENKARPPPIFRPRWPTSPPSAVGNFPSTTTPCSLHLLRHGQRRHRPPLHRGQTGAHRPAHHPRNGPHRRLVHRFLVRRPHELHPRHAGVTPPSSSNSSDG